MIIKTAEVPEGDSEITSVITALPEITDWPLFKSGLSCRSMFDRQGARIVVWIEFSGTVELDCARCLNQFDCKITGDTAVVLEHSSSIEKGVDPQDSGVDYAFDDTNPDVNISQSIYEEVLLSIPLKPLCAESCKGVLWKKEAESDTIDPRWEALRKLSDSNKKTVPNRKKS